MADAETLGAFLKARRAALDPEDLGLPSGLNQRRVAGLRREELAQLAGISVDYYTRLEQGRARNVSEPILDAVSRALRLTADEETYLRNLALPKRKRAAPPKAQRARPELQRLLDVIAVPAFIFGRYMEVLAWNPLCGALAFDFGSYPAGDRNIGKMFFLEENARELHPEWESVAKEVVANLRAEVGKHPGDPRMAQIIGELSVQSEDFRKMWARQSVQEKAYGLKLMRNPIVGDLSLHYETLRLPGDPDQGMVTYTAEAGSESERALSLLASWIADPTPRNARSETSRLEP
jgi:transcriptional regulator with XRE-family HTH domain